MPALLGLLTDSQSQYCSINTVGATEYKYLNEHCKAKYHRSDVIYRQFSLNAKVFVYLIFMVLSSSSFTAEPKTQRTQYGVHSRKTAKFYISNEFEFIS